MPGSVMPRWFDQQATGLAIAGLGDPTLGTGRPRGILGGHQPEVSADRAPVEALPVSDFDSQPERGQRGDSGQTPQPGHHRGVEAGLPCGRFTPFDSEEKRAGK